MFTVLNELHHAVEDRWHRQQNSAPMTGTSAPQPLELNLTVHADISGEDELSDSLRKTSSPVKVQGGRYWVTC